MGTKFRIIAICIMTVAIVSVRMTMPSDGRTGLHMASGAADDPDQTAAIQAALDRGGRVDLPATCHISATLVIRTPNVIVSGGRLIAARGGFNLIEIQQAGSGAAIRDVAFHGAAEPSDRQFGIFTIANSPAKAVTVSGCRFSGSNSGIKLDNGVGGWIIHGNRFSGLVGVESGHGYGVLCAGSDNNIHGNSFFGEPGKGRHGVYLSGGASHNLVTSNLADGLEEGPFCVYSKPTHAPCQYNLIASNTVRNCGRETGDAGAIELDGLCQYNAVRGNTLIRYKGHGIVINDAGTGKSHDNIIEGNTVGEAGWHGIYIKGSARTIIQNNVVRNSSQLKPMVYRGIVLQACVNAVLIGNRSYGESQRDDFFLNQTDPVPSGTQAAGNLGRTGPWQP